IQARVNAEIIQSDGKVRPSGGKITTYEMPQGRGVRIDGAAYSGWAPNPRYDSLVAKLIISDRKAELDTVLAATEMALSDYVIGGIDTSIPFLRSVLTEEIVFKGGFTTRFIDENVARLMEKQPAGNAISAVEDIQQNQSVAELPEGTIPLSSHILGTVIEIFVREGDQIHHGQEIAVLEAMKMEHQVTATASGYVERILISSSETVEEGQVLLALRPAEVSTAKKREEEEVDLDYIRPDLKALLDKQAAVLDEARPEAVAKRHLKDKSMIRENIALLVDEGSFSEYGSLNIAAQRGRHSVETLEKISPADGMVVGTARINGENFSEETASAVVLGYDYTVFAGTQGVMNHKKTDRMLHLAEACQLPIIFYGEGGGGRPGDVDINAASTLDVPTFQTYARLSGLVPRIAVASGRCFAGNAALMGVSDILIATEDTSLGMGGPA
ncbi:MAG: hypothetical protein MI743_13295, partial [Sneathiellales bacterium]|nr:hypothetical protein [Sneathiellales bacterium]